MLLGGAVRASLLAGVAQAREAGALVGLVAAQREFVKRAAVADPAPHSAAGPAPLPPSGPSLGSSSICVFGPLCFHPQSVHDMLVIA